MTDTAATTAGLFAAAYAAYYTAHHIVDHWGQSDHEATTKGQRTRAGRTACATHAFMHAVTAAMALALTAWATHLHPNPTQTAAAITLSAATHYWADRRHTLARLAQLAGQARFYRLGAPRLGRDDNPHLGTGAYHLDQSWHLAWLFIAALITAWQ